jgi:hypothetical protein
MPNELHRKSSVVRLGETPTHHASSSDVSRSDEQLRIHRLSYDVLADTTVAYKIRLFLLKEKILKKLKITYYRLALS